MDELTDERDGDDRFLKILLAVVLLAIVVGGGIDLILDRPESLASAHALYELSLMSVGLVSSLL